MANSPRLALVALCAAVIATTPLAIDMYLPAMPQIAERLQSDLPMVQQSLSIFLLFYGLGMLLFGPLADAIGRRPLALFGLAGFSLSSIFLSTVVDEQQLLFGRALQAFCGAAATVVIPGIIRATYQEQTAKGMSYVSMVMMLAPLLAPAIGSIILIWADWRAIFLALAAYGVVMCIACWRALPEIHASATAALPADTAAIADTKALSASAFKARLHNIQFFSAYATIFATVPARPLIAMSMMASFSFFCFLTAVPFVYIDYYHVNEQLFSLLFACNVVSLMAANFVNSRLVTRYGSVRLLSWALTSASMAAVGLLYCAISAAPLWWTVLMIAPLMASLGLVATNADALILMAFPALSGTATAVIGTLRFGVGALAGPLLALGADGSIVPFAALMAAGVIGIALARWWLQQQR